MRLGETAARPYAWQGHDIVRRRFEERVFARLVRSLLRAAGGALLDLGCGDGLAARLAGARLTRYLGIDLRPAVTGLPSVAHDLRDGLGPVGRRPFDVYLGSFGIASHLSPDELQRLLSQIACHGRSGSLVALEALGLYSLEWPRLWGTPAGPERTIPYRLGADVPVHPWAPGELFERFRTAGIEPLGARDRTLQAGPKLGESCYWPGLPSVRTALAALLAGGARWEALASPLPPLPAGLPARLHHALAERRREVVLAAGEGGPAPAAAHFVPALAAPYAGPALAEAIWALEPRTGGGYGHGLLILGRVR
jgi:SAM-dependent methyltransferase